MTYHYAWLIWSSAFLVPWAVVYLAFAEHRKERRWASFVMAPFGLTEPLFVPEYWNPPSLFELAQRTGFDIESIIFSFAIGGIGAVLYNSLMHKGLAPMDPTERHRGWHNWHRRALATPFALFPVDRHLRALYVASAGRVGSGLKNSTKETR